MDQLKHNLTAEDCACLDRVLQRSPELIQLAKACQDIGWDVSGPRAVLEEQHAMATKAKQAFFPNRS